MKSILSKTSRTGGSGDDQRLLVINILWSPQCQRRPGDVRGSLLGRCNAPRCMDHFCRVRNDHGFLTGATGWRRSAPAVRGAGGAGAAASPTGFPQPPQNFAVGSFSKPQAGQGQNRLVAAFSAMQLGQRTNAPPVTELVRCVTDVRSRYKPATETRARTASNHPR